MNHPTPRRPNRFSRTSFTRTILSGIVALLALPDAGECQTINDLFDQAGIAMREGRFRDAAAIFQEASQLRPGDADPLIGLGFAYIQLGQLQQAVAALNRALALNPNSSEAHTNMGFAHWQMGDRAGAIREYETATRLDPSNVQALYNLGNSYLYTGSPGNAIPPLQRALQLRPDHVDALITLGLARISLGNPLEAVDPLRQAVALAPDRGDAHFNLGLALGHSGDMVAAANEYGWLESRAPDLAPILHQQLGDRLLQARAHTPIPQPEAAGPRETDPSVALLGVSAGEGVEAWNQPGAEDAIVGSWVGEFKYDSGIAPLGEGVLTITKTGPQEYQVQLTAGWIRIGLGDEAPYFQRSPLRFVEKRTTVGVFPQFEYRGESDLVHRGHPVNVVFYLRPSYNGEVRLVPHIGNAGSLDLRGLVKVSAGG